MVSYGVCFWQGVIMTVVVYLERGLRSRETSPGRSRAIMSLGSRFCPTLQNVNKPFQAIFEVNSKILSIVFLFGLIIDTVCLGRVLSCMIFY